MNTQKEFTVCALLQLCKVHDALCTTQYVPLCIYLIIKLT